MFCVRISCFQNISGKSSKHQNAFKSVYILFCDKTAQPHNQVFTRLDLISTNTKLCSQRVQKLAQTYNLCQQKAQLHNLCSQRAQTLAQMHNPKIQKLI